MKQIILLRHGQSRWNLENRFTGWTDVDLTEQGRAEATRAGELMLAEGLKPRFYFTSMQRRAIHTLQLAAAAMERDWVPVIKDWHLNERHYGALQGLNKADTAAKYGDEQVHTWRRSYDVAPPQVTVSDPRYPAHDERYRTIPADRIPAGESLAMTVERVRPCWEELIAPHVLLYDSVLVAAHGNSLRALAMMLLHIKPEEIPSLEIATGQPWLFTLHDDLTVADHKIIAE